MLSLQTIFWLIDISLKGVSNALVNRPKMMDHFLLPYLMCNGPERVGQRGDPAAPIPSFKSWYVLLYIQTFIESSVHSSIQLSLKHAITCSSTHPSIQLLSWVLSVEYHYQEWLLCIGYWPLWGVILHSIVLFLSISSLTTAIHSPLPLSSQNHSHLPCVDHTHSLPGFGIIPSYLNGRFHFYLAAHPLFDN